VVEKLPDNTERGHTELRLRTIESTLAVVLHGASSQEREQAIRRMCQLGESIGAGDHFVRALSTLSGLYYTRGESGRAFELARRCLSLGNDLQDEGFLVDALYNAGMLADRCGNFREAVSHLEQSLRCARRMNGISQQWGIYHVAAIESALATALQVLGDVAQAVKFAKEALTYARESKHAFSLAAVLIVGAGQLSLQRRQADIARTSCDEAIALSEENAFAEWLPWGRFIHGWALFELGRVTDGLIEMEDALEGFGRLGGVPRLRFLIAVRAECIARIGHTEEALSIINDAVAHIEFTGDIAEHAEMLRLKGEVLLMRHPDNTSEAESCLRAALEVARAQAAKWWELRATASLARLLRDTNRRDEARTMLGEIYNWFTKGFDLLDLKEAKALLDELSC
jgi:adenylate cyclase